jgi:hypothetical protein
MSLEFAESSPGPKPRVQLPSQVLWVPVAALVTAVAGFVLIRPDWFHAQNGLDPFFYVGLSLNLSDFIAQGGDAHYFISRWTLYMPELLFTRLLGDNIGFVTMRLALLAFTAGAIISLRERSDRRLDSMVVALAVAFSPLVLRAVFVDYSDAIVVPFGVACVVGSVQATVRPRSSALLGAAGSIAVIANPFAVFMLMIPLGAYLWRARRNLLASVAVMGGAAILVAGVGLLFFRWKYGIPNIYEPTFQFIQANAGYVDPLKSPRLLWLGYRLWIYLPAFVLLTAWALSASGLVRWSQRDHFVVRICALQYAFQIFYQFGLQGSTLEVHYYFSYMVPAYGVAFAVVLYAALRRCSTWVVAAIGGALAVVLIGLTWLPPTRLRSGLDLVVILAVMSAVSWRYARRFPIIVPAAVLAVVFGVQTRSPTAEPRLPGEFRVEAGYDSVFDRGPSFGVQAFEQVSVFLDRMDRIDDDVLDATGFVLGGGLGHLYGAAYAVHVAQPSHWLNPPPGGADILEFAAARIAGEHYTYIAILGDPDELEEIVGQLRGAGVTLTDALLDYTARGPGPPTRVLLASIE